jgi:hypothetical protein
MWTNYVHAFQKTSQSKQSDNLVALFAVRRCDLRFRAHCRRYIILRSVLRAFFEAVIPKRKNFDVEKKEEFR